MYFVNMSDIPEGTVINRKFGSHVGFPFVQSVSVGSNVKFVAAEGGNLVLTDEGDNLFGKGLNDDSNELFVSDGNRKLSYRDVMDTEENPVIVVLCKQVEVFRGTSVGLKFMYINEDYIMAALVYGSCRFDGVELQRCDSSDMSSKVVGKVINGKNLHEVVSWNSKEQGIDYNMITDMVAYAHIKSSVTKDNSVTFSSSSARGIHNTIFDKSGEENAIKERDRKKAEAEAAYRRKQEKLMADRKAASERREAEALKKKEEENAKIEKKMLRGGIEKTAAAGASAFLEAIAKIEQGKRG